MAPAPNGHHGGTGDSWAAHEHVEQSRHRTLDAAGPSTLVAAGTLTWTVWTAAA